MSQSTIATPQNFRAVVKADNSVDTSWDAVPGSGVKYTLKETKNPDGLSNARGIAETSSHRTPPVPGDYTYWVVAVKGGHESEDSNKVAVHLPNGGPQPHEDPPPHGGHGGDTPWEILEIPGPGGSWNVGIGMTPDDGGEHEDFTPNQLRDGKSPYFVPTDEGRAVHFQSFMVGGRTSKRTKYTRSELRELKPGGHDEAEWDASEGVHTLSGTTAVMHLPPHKREICVAQVHDGDDRVQIRVEGDDGTGTTGFRWTVKIVDEDDNEDEKTVRTGYRLGDEVAWEIRVGDDHVHVKVEGGHDRDEPLTGGGMYFKTGCYVQSRKNNQGHPANAETEFGACTLRDLRVKHQPPLH